MKNKSRLLNYSKYLVEWIQNEVKKANMNGVVVGLSGGIDSSVVATLAKKAFPEDSLGIFLPIGKMGQDFIDAKAVAKKIDLNTIKIDLTKTFKSLTKATKVKNKLSIHNQKPRLRMTSLYAIAQEKKYLVLGTDNAAEWILGYFTKYGDGGVDLLPIVHLLKSDVTSLAKLFDLPKEVYLKAPTAALWDGQTDEKELGFSYDDVDKYLQNKKINEFILSKIKKQIKITEHKRKKLPMPQKMK